MAKPKNGVGGSGEGGAPAEAPTGYVTGPDGALASDLVMRTTSSMPFDAPAEIPPDAQVTTGTAALSTDQLKAQWATLRTKIDDAEKDAAIARTALREFEQELCERFKKAADEKKVEAVVNIGGRRMKVKARQAKHGGGLCFVDAPINAAIEL